MSERFATSDWLAPAGERGRLFDRVQEPPACTDPPAWQTRRYGLKCVVCNARGWVRHTGAQWPARCRLCEGHGRFPTDVLAGLIAADPTTFRAYFTMRASKATVARVSSKLAQLFVLSPARHDFARGIMPERAPVECERCGVVMRRTGLVSPHVEFKLGAGGRWTSHRPGCV